MVAAPMGLCSLPHLYVAEFFPSEVRYLNTIIFVFKSVILFSFVSIPVSTIITCYKPVLKSIRGLPEIHAKHLTVHCMEQ